MFVTEVCMTVDVEDWYDGMAVLGQDLDRPAGAATGLTGLDSLLRGERVVEGQGPGTDALTLFVVADYAPRVADELATLVTHGHEIASHGPDHGHLPEEDTTLVDWLRMGREALEDQVQVPVSGFRSPRFDVPEGMELVRYRCLLAEAGFTYVSDTHRLGPSSPVRELPVLSVGRLPLGGGSYQRLVPAAVTIRAVSLAAGPAVLYYHSYDFGATLPGTAAIRSVAVAKQLIGRGRVCKVFSQVLSRYGSRACGHVEW
ncbi:MAG: polysaccharide deacetylase family protein [Acidimicrobiales bacterium]